MHGARVLATRSCDYAVFLDNELVGERLYAVQSWRYVTMGIGAFVAVDGAPKGGRRNVVLMRGHTGNIHSVGESTKIDIGLVLMAGGHRVADTAESLLREAV